MLVVVPWQERVLHVYATADGTLSLVLASLREYLNLDDTEIHALLVRSDTTVVQHMDGVLYLVAGEDLLPDYALFMAKAHDEYKRLLEHVMQDCRDRLEKIIT